MMQQTDSVKRWFEIDLLKVFAIICIFSGHIAENVFSKEWEGLEYCMLSPFTSGIMTLITIITPFAFMFSMGCTMLHSRNKSPQKWIKRGFILILCWLLVNFIRSFSLYITFMNSDYPFSVNTFLRLLSVTDILLFAGIFFIYCGILSLFRVPMPVIMFIGVLISIIGDFALRFPPVGGLPTYLDNLAGGFVYIPDVSSFSFCNWVIVPILGIIWGKRTQNQH